MASVHEAVRDRYEKAARRSSCCGGAEGAVANGGSSCCGGSQEHARTASASTRVGYTAQELASLPEGADLALGCGNPTALAGLAEGEVVVDLGSGGGIDCFLAARRVGESGRVIGVDMTPQMIERARENAAKGGFTNVEFRLGEIEHLPVADSTVNVIISNCVVNLAPDKEPVLAEAFRVLAPGGRLLVSDLVLEAPLRPDLQRNMELLTGCIAGAMVKNDFLAALRKAGFEDVRIEREGAYLQADQVSSLAETAQISEADAREIAERVHSVSVYARKP